MATTIQQTIESSAYILMPVIAYGSVQITKPDSTEKIGEVAISNPVPDAPTNLVAIDAGKGDTVNLNWVSSASFFNVYKQVGLIYTRLNPLTLPSITSYSVGGLTPDVPITFIVRAVNGLGQESPNSNTAIATPTLAEQATRFSSPTYVININGSPIANPVLHSVNLVYGSQLSNASFSFWIDPRIATTPVVDDAVVIYINSKLVFRGYVKMVESVIDSSGLKITCTCYSKLIEYMWRTLFDPIIDAKTVAFNVVHNDPDGKTRIFNRQNANEILNDLGVYGAPDAFPGQVDVTDMTPIAAAEAVLGHIGNYRVYYDMNNQIPVVYPFGSGGYAIRQFFFGKNIISYNVTKSDVDTVRQITVIGAPYSQQYRTGMAAPEATLDADGKLSVNFSLTGKNIRDIQVFGYCRDKAQITYDDSIQVTLMDLEEGRSFSAFYLTPFSGFDSFHLDTFSLDKFTFGGDTFDLSKPSPSPDGQSSQQIFGAPIQNSSSNASDLYPAVVKKVDYRTVRQPMAAKIEYGPGPYSVTGQLTYPESINTDGRDRARVSLTEIPKIWFTVMRTGPVKESTIGKNANVTLGGNPNATVGVTILLYYDFYIGSIEVEYTADLDAPVVIAGSGSPSKSVTDSQYAIIKTLDTKNEFGTIASTAFDNEADVLNRMTLRANNELAKYNRQPVGGTITVLGDETLDLRSSVLIDSQLLEISAVTHSFENGFTTILTLTNEPFVVDTILPPYIHNYYTNQNTLQQNRNFFTMYETQGLEQVHKDMQSAKDKAEKTAKSSGPFANAQE